MFPSGFDKKNCFGSAITLLTTKSKPFAKSVRACGLYDWYWIRILYHFAEQYNHVTLWQCFQANTMMPCLYIHLATQFWFLWFDFFCCLHVTAAQTRCRVVIVALKNCCVPSSAVLWYKRRSRGVMKKLSQKKNLMFVKQ